MKIWWRLVINLKASYYWYSWILLMWILQLWQRKTWCYSVLIVWGWGKGSGERGELLLLLNGWTSGKLARGKTKRHKTNDFKLNDTSSLQQAEARHIQWAGIFGWGTTTAHWKPMIIKPNITKTHISFSSNTPFFPWIRQTDKPLPLTINLKIHL